MTYVAWVPLGPLVTVGVVVRLLSSTPPTSVLVVFESEPVGASVELIVPEFR
jgi:hypothetical protein